MTWLQMYDTGKGKTTKRKEVSGHQGLGGKDACIGRARRILKTGKGPWDSISVGIQLSDPQTVQCQKGNLHVSCGFG